MDNGQMNYEEVLQVVQDTLPGVSRAGYAGGTFIVRTYLPDGRNVIISDGDSDGEPFSGLEPAKMLYLGLYASTEITDDGGEPITTLPKVAANPVNLAAVLRTFTALPEQARPGDHWYEWPQHPVADWQAEVSNDETRQSYRDWARSREHELSDEEADSLITCTECSTELPSATKCEATEDGEHLPDMEPLQEPPANAPTRVIQLQMRVTVPNDGYDYSGDHGGRIERFMDRLLEDRLITSVSTEGSPSGSGYAGEVYDDPHLTPKSQEQPPYETDPEWGDCGKCGQGNVMRPDDAMEPEGTSECTACEHNESQVEPVGYVVEGDDGTWRDTDGQMVEDIMDAEVLTAAPEVLPEGLTAVQVWRHQSDETLTSEACPGLIKCSDCQDVVDQRRGLVVE